MGKFRFDICIGNPPYQEETADMEAKSNRQKPVKNIFQFFQMGADELAAEGSVLIYPGARWIHQFGKGLQNFGYEQMNDVHLKKLYFFPDAAEIFPGVQMADGITIVIKDKRKTTPGFQYVYVLNGEETSLFVDNPGQQLMPLNPQDISICEKIDRFVKKHALAYFHDAILPRSLFRIESSFVEENPDKVAPCEKADALPDESFIRLLTNDKAGKIGRARWFFANRSVIKSNQEYISQWQVVVSSANAGGQKRDNQLEIIDNHSAFGRSRVALRSFKTQAEAENFYKYVNSYLVRYAFLMTDESLTSLGKRVPDLMDYKTDNGFLDYSSDIDGQLFQLFQLTQEDIAYVKQRVDRIRE